MGFLHSIIQYISAACLLWIWRIALNLTYDHSELLYDRLFAYALVMSLGFSFHFLHARSRFIYLLHSSMEEMFRHTLRQAVVVFSTIPILVAATKDHSISRTFLFSFFPLLFLLLYTTNRYLPRLLSSFLFSGYRQQPTVVVASHVRLKECTQWLHRKTVYGIHLLGFVETSAAPRAIPGASLPFLGTFCDIETVLIRQGAAQLIALELPQAEDIHFLSELCDRLGVRFLIVNDLAEKLQRSLIFSEDDGFQMISFRDEPLECPINRLMKRALDIAISLPVVVFLLPATNLLVYCMQRRQAPGPLFFHQKRTGFQNKEFLICKYRTMYMNHHTEAVQATCDDPRVYPAGRWLRKHSIDELPQFLNVLKGEMSVVGPRPHLPEHSHTFTNAAAGFRVRAFIKPGITGLAQVEGFRGEVRELKNLTDRVRSDLYYLENWSLALEWKIIFKTARQLIAPPKSAY